MSMQPSLACLRTKDRRVSARVLRFGCAWALGGILFTSAPLSAPLLDSDTGLIPPGAGEALCGVGETRLPNGACCAKVNVSGCGECCTDGLIPDAKTGRCIGKPSEMLR